MTMNSTVVRASAVLLASLLAACGDTGEPAWIGEARAQCKPHGLALDRDSGGYAATNEILLCPDGTLRIVPMPGSLGGKVSR